jgi:hypothetical protein
LARQSGKNQTGAAKEEAENREARSEYANHILPIGNWLMKEN